MLLVFFLTFRYVYAGTPHAVYGVPPAETFVNSQPPRIPSWSGNTVGTQWTTNPYQPFSPAEPWRGGGIQSQPARTKVPQTFWAAPQTSAKLISAASATYRPYSGALPQRNGFYNIQHSFTAPNVQWNQQRQDTSDSRYSDFIKRYYDWYYRRGTSAFGFYPPPSPPQEPLGAYAPPAPSTAQNSFQEAPWWLSGGFANAVNSPPGPFSASGSPPGPPPAYSSFPGPPFAPSSFSEAPVTSSPIFAAPSSSSGGPVGPFTSAPAKPSAKQLGQKESSLPTMVSNENQFVNRVNEDAPVETPETPKPELDKPTPSAEPALEVASEKSLEPESKETNATPDTMTTPETTSEESSSSEESSPSSSEDSSSPSSEENSSPSSIEISSPTSEETSSSSEGSSSASSEYSSSPSSEETSSSTSEESSSPSGETSPPSSEESSSSTSEETSPSSSEDSTATENTTTESSDSSETNTVDIFR